MISILLEIKLIIFERKPEAAFEPLAPKASFGFTIGDILPYSVVHIRSLGIVPKQNLTLVPLSSLL